MSPKRDDYGTESGKNRGSEWGMEGDRMEGDGSAFVYTTENVTFQGSPSMEGD